MKTLLFLSASILILFPGRLLSAPVAINDAYPVEKGFSLGVSYAIEARDTPFFFGHNLKVNQSVYSIILNYTIPAGMNYSASIYEYAAEAADREATQPGIGASVAASSHIHGDGILSLVWNWHLALKGGRTEFDRYKGSVSDITHSYLISQASLTATSFAGVFSFSAGISFMNAIDEYRENTSSITVKKSGSSFIPLSGISVRFTDNVIITLSGYYGGIDGAEAACRIAF